MSKTFFNRAAIPGLAAYIRQHWITVSRDLGGVKDLPRFRDMGRKGYITKKELEAIGEEKSSRRKELLSDNDDAEVERVTKLAFAASTERLRMKLLCSLDGVAVPRASAILSWTHPERWPVIDQRAWRTLAGHNVVTGREKGTSLGILQWEIFLKAVDALSTELSERNLTPQEIDRILYQIDADQNGRKRKSGCCQ